MMMSHAARLSVAGRGQRANRRHPVEDTHGPIGIHRDGYLGQQRGRRRRRKSVFIGTGNNYSTPTAPAYVNCILAGGTPKVCLSPDDHVESIVAMDAGTGRIKWSQRLTDGDDWNVACARSPVGKNCPMPTGVDFDFGSAPNEFSVRLAQP